MNRRNFLVLMWIGWSSQVYPQIFFNFVNWSKNWSDAREKENTSKSISFYVAPNGNNNWSGKLAEPNKEQTDGPFSRIESARDFIRNLKLQNNEHIDTPINVFLRGGNYYLMEPLTFIPEDSGTFNAPITYRAYKEEKPYIIGGREIVNWKELKKDEKYFWVAEIPEVSENKWFFRQLWVNGQRRFRARHPKQGYLQVEEVPDTTEETSWREGQKRFRFKKGDISNWETVQDAEVVIMTRWTTSRLPVSKIDDQHQIISFNKKTDLRIDRGNPYYIENALEILNTPGEWYLQKKTGKLYYLPKIDEDLDTVEIIASVQSQLINFQGNPKNNEFVQHIHLDNLEFSYTESYYPDKSLSSDPRQGARFIEGAIYMKGASYCIFEQCCLSHLGNYAIELAEGCHNNKIQNCEIFDGGAGGIKIRTPTTLNNLEKTYKNEIYKCHIYNLGHIFHSAVAIWIGQSYNNRVVYNHIHNLYYTGISVGETWGYGNHLAQDNIIEYNHVHHIGSHSESDTPFLNDKGGIYTLGVQPGTVIRFNRIYDIYSWSFGGWGIYLDAGSSQILVEKNIVYHTRDGGFHIHYGKDNVVRNNIFALGKNDQIRRSKPEAHLSFTFENNIVYWEEGQLFKGNVNNLNFNFDRNLYWSVNNSEIRFGKMSWQEWQAKGMDINSLVADPLFFDPANDDFRLPPNSPAFEIGFEAIQLNFLLN